MVLTIALSYATAFIIMTIYKLLSVYKLLSIYKLLARICFFFLNILLPILLIYDYLEIARILIHILVPYHHRYYNSLATGFYSMISVFQLDRLSVALFTPEYICLIVLTLITTYYSRMYFRVDFFLFFLGLFVLLHLAVIRRVEGYSPSRLIVISLSNSFPLLNSIKSTCLSFHFGI